VVQRGCEIFRRSCVDGLEFFTTNNLTESSPAAVAGFLMHTRGLDRGQLGLLLSEPDSLILPAFLDHVRFSGVAFDRAFRAFFSKFRIPGDPAPIDRILSAFASKFAVENPDFAPPEVVSALTFTTLILHADAHYQSATPPMTPAAFRSAKAGIDHGRDLPSSFLDDLYSQIVSAPVYFNSAADVLDSPFLTRHQRAELYRAECVAAVRSRSKSSRYHEFIPSMFSVTWSPCLKLIASTIRLHSATPECLDGLSNLARIACHCYSDPAIDSIIEAFAGFTSLRTAKTTIFTNPGELASFRSLVAVFLDCANYITKEWRILTDLLTILDRFDPPGDIQAHLVSEIFSATVGFDLESLLDFTRSVCTLASKELKEKPPRLFLTEQLTVIAYYNMDLAVAHHRRSPPPDRLLTV
jgi:Sec7-like guanine-nucleotide exchange factor